MRMGQGLVFGGNAAAAGIDPTSLEGIASSVFDLDATKTASYGGTGQTFSNLIVSPADGSAQNVYDFFLGNSAAVEANADPVFTGLSGDPAAYFDMTDAGAFSTKGFSINRDTGLPINDQLAAQPDFIKKFHQSNEGQTGWIGMVMKHAPNNSGKSVIFGNENNATKQGYQVSFNPNSTTRTLTFQVGDGATGVTFVWNAELFISTHYLIFITLVHTGGNTTATAWINSINLGDVTQAVSTTTDATGIQVVGNDDSFSGITKDSQVVWGAMGRTTLTNSLVEDIRAILELRHNRTYQWTNVASNLSSVAGIGACLDLDLTVPASFDGTQTIKNLIESPAVGGQTNYDFWRGADGDEDAQTPDLSGVHGAGDSGLVCDGSQYLKLKAIASTIIAKAPRTDQAGYWQAMILDTENPLTGPETWSGSTQGAAAGHRTVLQSDENIDVLIANGASVKSILNVSGVLSAGTHLIIFSWDGTQSTGNFRVWVNSTTAVTETDAALNALTADASGNFYFGANGGGSSRVGNGTVLRAISSGNIFLTNALAASIFAHYETRHSVDYTP